MKHFLLAIVYLFGTAGTITFLLLPDAAWGDHARMGAAIFVGSIGIGGAFRQLLLTAGEGGS